MLDFIFPSIKSNSVQVEASLPTGGDQLHRQWALQISGQRKQFYETAEKSERGLFPIKNNYQQPYKDFFAYLASTIDLLEMLPGYATNPLQWEYRSGQGRGSISTVQTGRVSTDPRCQHCLPA